MLAISAPATLPPPISAPALDSCPWVKSEGIKIAPNGEYVVRVKNVTENEEHVRTIVVYMLFPNGDKAAALYDGDATIPPNGEGLIGIPDLPAPPVDGVKFAASITSCWSLADTGA